MKRINIGRSSSIRISRFDTPRSKQVYFTSQRKLLELKRSLSEQSQDREQTTKQSRFKMKKMLMFALIMACLVPLALGGCSSTQNTDSSTYGKSKSGNERSSGGSSGGY